MNGRNILRFLFSFLLVINSILYLTHTQNPIKCVFNANLRKLNEQEVEKPADSGENQAESQVISESENEPEVSHSEEKEKSDDQFDKVNFNGKTYFSEAYVHRHFAHHGEGEEELDLSGGVVIINSSIVICKII